MSRFGTPGYKLLRGEFNMMFSEPWGDTLEWMFSISEILTHWVETTVPESWDFHDSPVHHAWAPEDEGYTAELIAECWDDGSVTTADLITFGEVLTRYADLLRSAGRSGDSSP